MELNFTISEELLIVTGLLQKPKIVGWVDLQNTLWDKYKLGYELLQGNSCNFLITENSKYILEKSVEEVKLLIEEGLKTAEFGKLLQNAQEYKRWLENEWLVNKERVVKELKEITRTDLPKGIFTVYVVGNLVHMGRHLGNNRIAWGHKEDWPNYSLVYLSHEYLHEMFTYSKLEHAIIELATDNELRIRLNKSGEYFECNGKSVGHTYLRNIEKKFLPDWLNYLTHQEQNIFEFADFLKKKYPRHLH